MNPKYPFYKKSKPLNKTHISLNENVFSLIKRVKQLSVSLGDFFIPITARSDSVCEIV